MSSHRKQDEHQADEHDGHTVDTGAPSEVVKLQPGKDGPAVPLPLEPMPEATHEQPPAGPAPDLFATWNDPAPLDEADEADDEEGAGDGVDA